MMKKIGTWHQRVQKPYSAGVLECIMPSSVIAMSATEPATMLNSRLLKLLRSNNHTSPLMAARISETDTIIDQTGTTQCMGRHARLQWADSQSGVVFMNRGRSSSEGAPVSSPATRHGLGRDNDVPDLMLPGQSPTTPRVA